MADKNPFDDPNFGSNVASDNPFDDPDFGKPSGVIRRIADQGVKLAQGVVGVPEAAVGVADLVTGGQAGKLAESAGVRFKEAKQALGEYLSPEQKAADAEVAKAEGFLPTVGAMVQNPSTIIGSAVESAPSMLVGGAASRGLLKVAPKIGAIAAGAAGEGITAAGQNAEQVRQEDPNGTLTPGQSAILAGSGVLTGGISGVAGKFANKLGIGDVQTMLARGKAGVVGEEAAQEAAKKGLARKVAEGAVSEGVLQELPQSYQEQVAQNLAQGKPWDEGAGKAGAQGMMAGAVMGGGGNVISHAAEGPQAPPVEPVAPAAAPLQIGNTPDPYLSFPDGSVARRSEVEAHINSLPADQQPAARAAMMGLAPQPAESVAPEPTPTAGPMPALGYSPLAGTPIVHPDGTVTLNGEQEFQRRTSPQPVLPSEAMGLDPTAGPMSAAAVTAVDTGVHQQHLDQQQQQVNQAQAEADQAAYNAHVAQQDEEARQQDTADKPITSGKLAEAAMSEDDKRAVLFSNQAVADNESRYPGTQDGDILNGAGAPFTNYLAAGRRASMEGKDWTVIKTGDKQFVARRKDAINVSPTAGVLSNNTGNGGSASAQFGPGMAPGNGSASGTEMAGETRKPGQANGVQPGGGGNLSPDVSLQRTGPDVSVNAPLATVDTTSTAIESLANVENAPAPGTEATPAAPQVEAPATVEGNAAAAIGVPGAGSAELQATGVASGIQPTQSLARDSSWVIKNKATGEVVMETFDRAKVDALNTAKYEAVPILKHLQDLNKSIVEESSPKKPNAIRAAKERRDMLAKENQALAAEGNAAKKSIVKKPKENASAEATKKVETAAESKESAVRRQDDKRSVASGAETNTTVRSEGGQSAQESGVKPASHSQGREVSRFNGKYGKGMNQGAAKLEAARLNKTNDGIVYTAEEHNDSKLENPYAVVGRKAAPQFSRGEPGKPSTVAAVQKSIRQLTGITGRNQLGSTVATTAAEIKDTWEPLIGQNVELSSDSKDLAQAFFDPKSKTVFLIADHIKAGDEMAVLAHELMHAHGMTVLGKQGWDRLHGVIGTWENAAEGTDELAVYTYASARAAAAGEERVQQMRADAKASGKPAPTSAQEDAARGEMSSQELFPYAVESAMRDGIRPNAIAKQGTVQKWLADVIKAMKDVWAKLTGKPELFAAQDLVDLAYAIAQMENPAYRAEISVAFGQNDQASTGTAPQYSRSLGAVINDRKTTITGDTGRYTPEQLEAMKRVGFQVEEPSLKERAQSLWKDAGKKLAQGIVDQFAPVKDLSKEAYGLLRMAKGSAGAFEAMLKGGKLKITDGIYDFDDANKGGVVDKLLIPLQGEHHDFMRWVAANRAERLTGEGKENLFSAKDISALKTLDQGTTDFDYTIQTGLQKDQVTRDRTKIYADANRVFNEFNKNVLDMAEQSGLIDGASRKIWEHEFYVPFYRVADEDSGGVRGMNVKGSALRQQAFKELKGGKNALNVDLLDSTLMNWAHLLDASAKNRAAKATIDAAERMGIATGGNQSTLASMGSSINNKNGVVWFMDGGKKRYSLIDNTGDGPYLMTALSALEYAGMRNPVMNAMGAMKHALTVGVTASPFFKVRNLIRDSVQAIGTSNLSYNPAKNISEGWKLTDPKSDAYFRLLAGGGTIHFGTMMEGSEAKRVQALVESGVDDATILNNDNKIKAFYRKVIEPGVTAYNELGNRGEAINRAALYDQLRKQGMNHAEASLQARDLMDFSMQGSFTTIRFLTQVVPFFNARIQGLYKLGKSAKEDPKRFGAVLGATALFSLALLAAYHDDDDFKKREDWDRNNFWWFKFGGKAFRIPRPFEIGAIATLAERGAELAFDKEMTGKRFGKQVMTLLGDNLSMNPVPQLVKPILDVYANKDSFSGRPIETMGMDKLKPEYRFTDNTSMIARGASTAANAATSLVGATAPSPVQIDSMLRGYFGWLGSMVVGAADTIARPATDQPGHAAPDYWKTATGSMVSDLRDAPSRYVSAMYDQAKEIEQAYGTHRALLKEGKIEEATNFLEANRADIAKYHNIEHIKKIESTANNRIRMIERSSLSGDEKRDKIREINIQKDRAAHLASP